MESWEFLFQKEGSHLWTPITQPTWQLDEGKYRIMAHSSQAEFKVEIRVTHQSDDLESEVTTIYQGCRSTNSQGLIMILPVTELKAGSWEIKCYGDLMSELLGTSWQKRLQIEVVGEKITPSIVNKADCDDLDPILEEVPESQSTPLVNISQSADLEATNLVTSYRQHSNQISLSEFQATASDYFQQLQQLLKEEIEPQLTASVVNPVPLLGLGLNQDAFIRSVGESILLSGTVEAEEMGGVTDATFSGKFRYQLLDPHSEEILLEIEEDIQEETLPFMFNYALDVPNQWEIPLLVGEVILETATGVKIDYQSFTVTTDLTGSPSRSMNYTITLSNAENNSSFAFDLFLDNYNDNSQLNVHLPEPTKMASNLTYYPSNSTSKLPPKIAQVSASEKTIKSVQLPLISQPKPTQSTSKNESNRVKAEKLATITKNQISDKNQSFELLNLQERFISRLNSLSKS
jgi:hypothetical protein